MAGIETVGFYQIPPKIVMDYVGLEESDELLLKVQEAFVMALCHDYRKSYPSDQILTLSMSQCVLLTRGGEGAIYTLKDHTDLIVKRFKQVALQRWEHVIEFSRVAHQVPPHPHLNAFRGLACFPESMTWGVLFQRVYGDALSKSNDALSTLPKDKRVKLMVDLAQAARYLAEHGVPHRDLNDDNVMLAPSSDSSWNAVVIDWVEVPGPYNIKGTPYTGLWCFGFYVLPKLNVEKDQRVDEIGVTCRKYCNRMNTPPIEELWQKTTAQLEVLD